jgi:hypothetical protein
MVRYDEHAEFQLERRGIAKDLVEETLQDSDKWKSEASGAPFFDVCQDEITHYGW